MTTNVQHLVWILAIGFAAGCVHRGLPISESEAMEYGADLLKRNVPPEAMPQQITALYKAQVQSKIRKKIREEMIRQPFGNKKDQGKVSIEFKIHRDGTVSNYEVISGKEHPNLVSKALTIFSQAAPFEPWPEEMKQAIPDRFLSWRQEINFHLYELDPIDRPVPRIDPIFDPQLYRR